MDEQNQDAIQDMVANADNTATNQQITNNKVAKPQESETQNLDVLLQDPKLQAEFDKKLEKAINKALTNKEQEYSKRESALQASINTEKEKMRQNILEEIEARKKKPKKWLKCQWKKDIKNKSTTKN